MLTAKMIAAPIRVFWGIRCMRNMSIADSTVIVEAPKKAVLVGYILNMTKKIINTATRIIWANIPSVILFTATMKDKISLALFGPERS
jgi:hypothetical protein